MAEGDSSRLLDVDNTMAAMSLIVGMKDSYTNESDDDDEYRCEHDADDEADVSGDGLANFSRM